jgi:hypothetical protein
MDADAVLAAHAERHHAVFRTLHAGFAGLTARQIQVRIADRRWQELYRDVFRISGAPLTWKGELLAACWAGGFRALASHRAAAKLHGLPGGRDDVLEITCPHWRRARHRGLLVHETRALAAPDMTMVDGIPVTTVDRTLFDLAGLFGSRRVVELALENALRRELVTLDQLDGTVRRLSRRGRRGGPALRGLLEAREPTRRPTESEMETLLVQTIRAHGLPEPVVQYEVWSGAAFVARVDAAYPEARVAIEYDSDAFHTGRTAVSRDRQRRHRLVAAGWITIDVGAEDLSRGGALACAAIAEALRRRSGVAGQP